MSPIVENVSTVHILFGPMQKKSSILCGSNFRNRDEGPGVGWLVRATMLSARKLWMEICPFKGSKDT